MKQKHATEEDVYRIMDHVINLRRLDDQGFYETIQFVYGREIVPIGFIPKRMRMEIG